METQTAQNPLPYANLRVWPSGEAQKAAALALIEEEGIDAFSQEKALEWSISPLLYGLMKAISCMLPKEKQKQQILVFLKAPKVGADPQKVYFEWARWMFIDDSWGVRQWTAEDRRAYLAMTDVANLCARAINGNMPSEAEWANAAADAAVADAADAAFVAAAAVALADAFAAAFAAAFALADAFAAAAAVAAAAARAADAARAKHEWAQAAAGKLQELLTEASAAA